MRLERLRKATQMEGGIRWGRNPAALTSGSWRAADYHQPSASLSVVQHPPPGDRQRPQAAEPFIHKTDQSAGENFPSQCEQSWMKPSLSLSLSLCLSPLLLSLLQVGPKSQCCPLQTVSAFTAAPAAASSAADGR